MGSPQSPSSTHTLRHKTACEPCPISSWCSNGSSAPIACTNGTVGPREGLTSDQDCEPCPILWPHLVTPALPGRPHTRSLTRPFCKLHGGGRRCESAECTKSAASGPKLLCARHGGGHRCESTGCDRIARAGTFKRCVAHGGGNRCAAHGCNKSARAASVGTKRKLLMCAKHRLEEGEWGEEEEGEEEDALLLPSEASLQLLLMEG